MDPRAIVSCLAEHIPANKHVLFDFVHFVDFFYCRVPKGLEINVRYGWTTRGSPELESAAMPRCTDSLAIICMHLYTDVASERVGNASIRSQPQL